MAYQTVFRRYELKYLLTQAQKERILQAMAPYMKPDPYGATCIRNIYFDTDDYRLIRRSIEKPAYKEKLRLRSYCQADVQGIVFAELKKKYRQVVYKRRLALPQDRAMDWFCGHGPCPEDTQISREIDYFLRHYGHPQPKVFLSYQRQAYYGKADPGFRVTFDTDIRCRREELTLTTPAYGDLILEEGKVLMELKCGGGIPLWMVRILSQEHIYKTAFSKYGIAYQTLIFPTIFTAKEQPTDGYDFQRII